MKRLLLLSFLLLAASAHAQTTVATVAWNQSEPVTKASTLTVSMQVDAAAAIPLATTCVSAPAPATGSMCSATFPVSNLSTAHTYLLLVCADAAGSFCASNSINGAVPGTSGFKIKITQTQTVTVGGNDH